MKEFYDPDYIPRLRKDLDFIPAQYQGKTVWIVRNSMGLIATSLILPEETIAILSLIDGKKSIREQRVRFWCMISGKKI
ncbi:MAG: hypothetical protein JW755_09990 [Candidatus Aminicenantes bacterium]|nr:hypothetical protein [Candidatus Aminicenantes bacterium]